jgi:TonB family protein
MKRSRFLTPLLLALTFAASFAPSAAAQTTDGLSAPKPPENEVQANTLSKLPKQTKFVEAQYPPAAAEQRIEAEVGLMIDIDATGQVTGVVVTEPANPPGMGFDEAATEAAQQFEFEPAEMNGKPIAIQLNYKTKFKLKPQAPPPPPPPPVAPAAPPPPPVPNFTGQLRERGTRLLMPGVVVTIFHDDESGKPTGFEATTDGEGRFEFFGLAPGEWKLLVEAPGFYPYRTSEAINANEAVKATYYVERGTYNPYDVTVTATRPRKEVSRTIIDAKLADKIPGTVGDPLAVVQNFAGVARPPFNGLLIVRGSAPEDTRYFVDGAEIPLVYHFGGLKSVIPVGMLDSIEFYPGNFSPMYGRATGGVVDIQVKKLQPPKLGGYVDINLLDSGFYAEMPIGKTAAVAVSARRSYIDVLIKSAVPDDAGVNLVTAPRYYDYQLLANWRPAPAHDLRAFFFGTDDQLRILFQNPTDVDPTIGVPEISNITRFYRSLLTYKYIPSERFSNDLKLSQGRNQFMLFAGPLRLDVNLYTVQLRDTLRFKVAESLSLNVGFDGAFTRFDALVQLPLPPKEGEPPNQAFDLNDILRSQNKNVNGWYPAGFAEAEWRPLRGLMLLPGVRVDRFSRAERSFVQPRITARWDLGRFVIKGGAGLFGQEPDVQQGEDDAVFGNPNLDIEKARHYSAGVEFKPRPWLSFDGTVFYKDLYDLVSKTDATYVDAEGMTKPLRYDNGGRGHVYGFEFVARHEFTKRFTGWLAYTLMKSSRRDSGATADRLFDFDQTHNLVLVGSYLLPRNWQVGGRFRMGSGLLRTPVNNAVFNSSADRYDPTFGGINTDRNPFFHQLDLRIDKRWIYPRWIFNAYLDVQNIYNRANVDALQYNFNYRASKPQQGLPILTILGLRAEF